MRVLRERPVPAWGPPEPQPQARPEPRVPQGASASRRPVPPASPERAGAAAYRGPRASGVSACRSPRAASASRASAAWASPADSDPDSSRQPSSTPGFEGLRFLRGGSCCDPAVKCVESFVHACGQVARDGVPSRKVHASHASPNSRESARGPLRRVVNAKRNGTRIKPSRRNLSRRFSCFHARKKTLIRERCDESLIPRNSLASAHKKRAKLGAARC